MGWVLPVSSGGSRWCHDSPLVVLVHTRLLGPFPAGHPVVDGGVLIERGPRRPPPAGHLGVSHGPDPGPSADGSAVLDAGRVTRTDPRVDPARGLRIGSATGSGDHSDLLCCQAGKPVGLRRCPAAVRGPQGLESDYRLVAQTPRDIVVASDGGSERSSRCRLSGVIRFGSLSGGTVSQPLRTTMPTTVRRPGRRTLAATIGVIVASLLLVAGGQASAATSAPDPQRAAAYLTAPAQLVDGHYYDPYDSGQADWGLTIDGAFALAAERGHDAAYARLVDFLAGNGKDKVGTDVISWTGIGTDYVSGGSIGKLALLALTAGRDPRAFAGHDLLAEMVKATCTGTTPIGQSPCQGAGNYAGGSSVFAQALGVIGQVRGGARDAAAKPAAFLLSLQDTDGGWPSLIPSGGDASDVDSTALAVMALTMVPGDAAAAAAKRGVTWLSGTQLADGSFPGYAPTGSAAAHSTNSTGLAIQALRLSSADHAAALGKALTFLATTQNSDGGFDIDSGTDGSDVRATTQVVNGIVGRSYATLLHDLGATGHAATGAAYLVGQLVAGNHLESSYDDGSGTPVVFVDYGLTADLALALASTHTQDKALARVVGYLRSHVDDYSDPTGKAGGPFSGAVAKLAVVAESTGQDPTSFGGADLITTLTGNVCTTGNPDPSAFDACTAVGDFRGAYSGVSQALAVLALGRAGVAVPAPALTRLAQLQCADGGFSSSLYAPCSSDVDTTGYAVQALTLQPGSHAALTKGWAYLRAAQGSDGGWSGASGVSTNSTALAAQAELALLAHAGYVDGVASDVSNGGTPAGSVTGVQAAFRFLELRQQGDGGFAVSTTETGDDAARTRATTQAVSALAQALLTTVSDPVTPIDPAPPTTTTTTNPTSATTTIPTSTTTGTTTTTTSSTSTSTGTTTSATSGTSGPVTSTATATGEPTPGSTSAGTSHTAAPVVPGGGATPPGAVSSDLARTGTPVALLVGAALLLLLVGIVLLWGRRLTVDRGPR